jgi:hypothetical protein
MGVITTFDEKRDTAKSYIRRAIENLTECVNPSTYGYEEKREEYIDQVVDVLAELLKSERKL